MVKTFWEEDQVKKGKITSVKRKIVSDIALFVIISFRNFGFFFFTNSNLRLSLI